VQLEIQDLLAQAVYKATLAQQALQAQKGQLVRLDHKAQSVLMEQPELQVQLGQRARQV
jgi:hypothetical protein